MSLVAVVERANDQAGHVPKTKIVPVGMPQDTEFASYFGGKSRAHLLACARMPMFRAADESGGMLADTGIVDFRAAVLDAPILGAAGA